MKINVRLNLFRYFELMVFNQEDMDDAAPSLGM